MPADFVPALVEMPAWFDASAELQRFRDHHTAKGSLMADWNAAWRTWCGNAKRFHVDRGGGGPRAGPPPGSTQIALSVLAQLEAEEAERNRS